MRPQRKGKQQANNSEHREKLGYNFNSANAEEEMMLTVALMKEGREGGPGNDPCSPCLSLASS